VNTAAAGPGLACPVTVSSGIDQENFEALTLRGEVLGEDT